MLLEIKYFWWSHVTATISLDLPTFLQMPWNVAQSHQTLFPARTSGHTPKREKGSGLRDYTTLTLVRLRSGLQYAIKTL